MTPSRQMDVLYNELGELITAIGESWFANTLPVVLQSVFNYDYFLLARYRPGVPLQVVRSDFQDVQMQKTLDYLVTETYVAEPIYRLHSAGNTCAGVFDMSELTRQSLALPEPPNYDLPHLVRDNTEEIGWRTVGWPEYQQETCILVPLPNKDLIAVSLFNFGLSTLQVSSREHLEAIFPVVSSAIARHFSLVTNTLKQPDRPDLTNKQEPAFNRDTVSRFFESRFSVTITAREAEVLTPLLRGDTLAAIAKQLNISIYTARTHRRNVYRKIGHGRLLELINQFHAFNHQAGIA